MVIALQQQLGWMQQFFFSTQKQTHTHTHRLSDHRGRGESERRQGPLKMETEGKQSEKGCTKRHTLTVSCVCVCVCVCGLWVPRESALLCYTEQLPMMWLYKTKQDARDTDTLCNEQDIEMLATSPGKQTNADASYHVDAKDSPTPLQT